MTEQVRRTWRVMRSIWAIAIAYVISITALGMAYTANTNALHEADNRATATEAQNERLRIAFCGILEPFAYAEPASTDAGRKLQISFKRAASAEGIGCTPDPNDGR